MLNLKNSRLAIFTFTYSSILSIFFICSIFIWQNETIRMLFDDLGLFVWMIIIPAIVTMAMSLYQFQNTRKEVALVEKLINSSNEIDISNGILPVGANFSESMFVNHFKKIHTINGNCVGLDQYLEEMIFRGPSWIKTITNSFPLLGIFGTTAGIATVFLNKKTGNEALIGFAYAISTTLLGVYLKYFFSLLNHTIILERNALLKAVVFLFNGRGK